MISISPTSAFVNKICYTNAHKYAIFHHDQYKIRKNNIKRLSVSIEKPKLYNLKDLYILQYDIPIADVWTFLTTNRCSIIVLFTILHQCCNSIALYHGLLNCYHSNTTLSNFDIYENHICSIIDIHSDNNTLTLDTKVQDYDMLFDSFENAISKRNGHFANISEMYRNSFMAKMGCKN
jgi:hypothetical protein